MVRGVGWGSVWDCHILNIVLLTLPMVRTGGKLFSNQNLFQLVITLSTLVKLIYEKTVIIYCLQGGVGWGGVGWGIGGSWLCHNKNPADLPVRLCNILIIPLHYKLIGSHFSAVPPCKLLCAP